MDLNALLLSVVFGSLGAGFFVYGKKQQMLVPMVVGLCLMVYPYFMPNNWSTCVVGVLLSAVPYFLRF